MRILALDLGKLKTAAYLLITDGEGSSHTTVRTNPQVLHDLLVDLQPDRVVFEICPLAGWLCDLTRALGLDTQVANVAHDAWRWRNVRSKSDRLDAQKLAELSQVGQLPLVHLPERSTRQWRSLIAYRRGGVGRRTQIQNAIRRTHSGKADHYGSDSTHTGTDHQQASCDRGAPQLWDDLGTGCTTRRGLGADVLSLAYGVRRAEGRSGQAAQGAGEGERQAEAPLGGSPSGQAHA